MSGPTAINSGPGRVLVGLYGLFALAAGARAGVQIATEFGRAPLSYLLSAAAAAIYLVATLGLARGGDGGRRLAVVCCTIELVGVLAVGAASLVAPDAFARATVWSGFGQGYGFVPLALPVLGLLWLRGAARTEPSGVEDAHHGGRRAVDGGDPSPLA